MRYSTLASTVLLAIPALARPVTINSRATGDVSMVERELQDALMERGYYDTLLSRDLEARKTAEESPDEKYHRERQKYMLDRGDRMMGHAEGQTHSAGTSNRPAQHSGSRPRHHSSPPHPSGGAGQGARGQHHSREYDPDGGLFERDFEVDELD
ncbi:uncharacterized protein B0H18DRAFT_956129 [Fomitopsis serialis]|uniref:uncharacterized protein n=1 Tax=Fomitopsis serialis TaxID=139415 RepID=UPI0020082A2D|nr:uncharacterized protein B0H18DRAFT_956129 [Neoantrodia serialis]KAH9922760.1 hypothetical protein B0H18DRAFT_956129 [Neoantrodia serialis]